MCVIIAKKIKSKVSNKEKWFLFKLRDRNYNPIYSLKIIQNGDIETLFLTDQINEWSEGINSKGIMIVSAALDNHTDSEDNGQMSDRRSIHKKNKDGVKALREAMASETIEQAVKILKENRFVGTSFISDGDRLIILEIYVNDNAYKREELKIGQDKLKELSKAEQIIKIFKGITDSDYDIAEHEVKKDTLAIRTNHGKLLRKAGYTKKDKEGYTSSVYRYEITYNALKNVSIDTHPFAILDILKSLKGIEKNPQNNPIRIKTPKDDGKQPFYTTTIIMLSSSGILFAVPINDDIENTSKVRLRSDRKVDFVLLPKNIPLFENSFFSYFIKY